MAKIDMEGAVDHLRSEMRRALADSVRDTIPDVEFDEYELYRSFRRAVRRKCNSWEKIPDKCLRD